MKAYTLKQELENDVWTTEMQQLLSVGQDMSKIQVKI
jgi:hypothetical protein